MNKILIIIPVFNEEKNVASVIEDINKNYKEAEILIVNDGSTDKTREILKGIENIFLIDHLFNMGIGASFETGCLFALMNGYKYIVRMDGDGQHSASYINEILEPVKTDKLDIAIGSRFLKESEFTSTFLRLIGIRAISLLLKVITGKNVTDPTSGFYAMNRRAFEFFSENCAEDYPEPEILIYHKNFRISEVPISMTKRYDGASSITPLKSIYYMVKVLLSLFMHIFRKEKP